MGPVSPAGHARPRRVLLDVDDASLADALAGAFAPHRVERVDVTSGPDAVAAAVDGAADLVVCAPAPATDDLDDVHVRIALRAGWWVAAADVVGAALLLASSDQVFDRGGADRGESAESGPPAPDEFEPPRPTTPRGRAWRAAEAQVRGTGGVVVRSAEDDDPTAVATTLRWASTATGPGPWHHPATATLDTRHTRLVRDGGRRDPDVTRG